MLRPKVKKVTEAERLEIFRHWVHEASNAVQDIAFIEAFEETRAAYAASKDCSKGLSNPKYSAIGRVAMRRLFATTDALVLFCRKAVEDSDDSFNVKQLKNDVVKRTQTSEGGRRKIVEEFKAFEKSGQRQADALADLRNKVIAHSDRNVIFGDNEIRATIKEILDCARKIIQLIQVLVSNSGIKKIGTLENPTTSDNSLIIQPFKFAQMDAQTFWCANFAEWAK